MKSELQNFCRFKELLRNPKTVVYTVVYDEYE